MTDATITTIVAGIPPTLLALAAFIQGIRNSSKADTIIAQGDGHTTMLTEALKKSTTDAAEVAATASVAKDALIEKLTTPVATGSKGDRAEDKKK